MKYQFKISINTDGDFCFPFVPCGMTRDGDKYYFLEEYRDRERAVQAACDICQFLKNNLKTNRDYVRKEIRKFFVNFEARLKDSEVSDSEFVSEYLDGNYNWTEISFEALPTRYKISFVVDDEEVWRIQKSIARLKDEDIKKAVLDLCERVEK